MKFILYRMLQGALVLLIVTALTFGLLAAAGGDALTALRDSPMVSEEALDNLRQVYGLDQPLVVRYGRWAASAVRGELGHSYSLNAPVAGIVWSRLLRTAILASVAMVLACLGALSLSISAARHPRVWVDRVCEVIILLASSTPHLLLALLALSIAARASLPVSGARLPHLLLSAIVLSIPLLAVFLAQTRASLADSLEQEFVHTARAKGLPEGVVLFRHMLRPSLGPLFSVFGVSFGALMSGSMIVEPVLDWPGLGQLSVGAVLSRDVPLLMGVVLVSATVVLAGNFLTDFLLRWNDPRLR